MGLSCPLGSTRRFLIELITKYAVVTEPAWSPGPPSSYEKTLNHLIHQCAPLHEIHSHMYWRLHPVCTSHCSLKNLNFSMDEPKEGDSHPPSLPRLKRQNALWGTKFLQALNPKGSAAG